MIERRRPACSPRHRRWCSRAHSALVSEYRDQRDAREALRESGALAPTSTPGAAGSAVAFYQLEREEFDRLVPAVTFKEWLIGHAGERHFEAEPA